MSGEKGGKGGKGGKCVKECKKTCMKKGTDKMIRDVGDELDEDGKGPDGGPKECVKNCIKDKCTEKKPVDPEIKK